MGLEKNYPRRMARNKIERNILKAAQTTPSHINEIRKQKTPVFQAVGRTTGKNEKVC